MNDSISRKDALSLLTVFTEKDALGSTPAEIIKHMPSVDPVVHGHWYVYETGYGDTEAKCSICGFETLVNEPGNGLHMVGDLKYCPHCGAKMDLLDDDTKWEKTKNGVRGTKYNCTKEEIEEVKAIMREKVTEWD